MPETSDLLSVFSYTESAKLWQSEQAYGQHDGAQYLLRSLEARELQQFDLQRRAVRASDAGVACGTGV